MDIKAVCTTQHILLLEENYTDDRICKKWDRKRVNKGVCVCVCVYFVKGMKICERFTYLGKDPELPVCMRSKFIALCTESFFAFNSPEFSGDVSPPERACNNPDIKVIL